MPYTTVTSPYASVRPIPPQVGGYSTVITPPAMPTIPGSLVSPYHTTVDAYRPVPPSVVTPYYPTTSVRPAPPMVVTPMGGQIYWPFQEPIVQPMYQQQFQLQQAGSPGEVLQRFQQGKAQLNATYSQTSMSAGERDNIDSFMVKQAVNQLLNGCYGASYQEKKSVIDAIYSNSTMSASMRDGVEGELANRELGRIMGTPDSFQAKKMQIDALYSASPISAQQRDAAELQAAETEANRIILGGGPMYEREQALNQLYSASPMSSQEHQSFVDRLHSGY